MIYTKPIYKFSVAKKLLQYGNPIVDIKQNEHDKSKVVFYFNQTQKFFKDLHYILGD